MNMRGRVMLWACGLILTGVGGAADWAQFRGPNGTGVVADKAAYPTVWSDTQNVKWSTPLPGPGSSSPIVVGDKLFVTCFSGVGENGAGTEGLKRHLICIERASGKIVWTQTVAAEQPEDPYMGGLTEHGYASSTPASDGERVYVFYGKTGALAYDLTGKELWRVNLGKSSSNKRWGSSASPVLFKNVLVVNAADEGRCLVGLDKLTGKQVWKIDAPNLELCYGTPMPVENSAGQTDLALALPGEVWCLNPETGAKRWFARTEIAGNVSPSVAVGDGVLYATGGWPRQGSIAVRLGGEKDVSASHILWNTMVASYVPTPVAVGGYLYALDDSGAALCLDAKSGKLIYKERVVAGGGGPGGPGGRGPGNGPPPGGPGGPGGPGRGPGRGGMSKPVYASPVCINGLIYAPTRRNGTVVIEAKPEFKLVAQNRFVADTTDFNATPACADGQIFLRSNRALYCVAGPSDVK